MVAKFLEKYAAILENEKSLETRLKLKYSAPPFPRLSLASKRKQGIASFLFLALRFYPLSFPVRRTPKVFEK